jgi:ATP-dependent DNA helicase RecG
MTIDKSLEKIRTILFDLNKNPEIFYQNPGKYINSIIDDIEFLDKDLTEKIKNNQYNFTNISSMQKLLSEINLLVVKFQQHIPIIDNLKDIKGVGKKVESVLNKMGIFCIEDLLFYFPFRYESVSQDISSDKQILSGKFIKYDLLKTKTGKRVFRAFFQSNNMIFLGVWFKYGNYIFSLFKEGVEYNLFGEVKSFYNNIAIFHPEILSDEDVNKIRPVYSLTQDISQKKLSSIIKLALNNYKRCIPDYLPFKILKKHNYPTITEALEDIHFPEDLKTAESIMNRTHKSLVRFIYEDFFYIQIGFLLNRKKYEKTSAPVINTEKLLLEKIKGFMPFNLTSSQKKVLTEILNDLATNNQMNRLIQGDVGSGKTIIAFISAIIAIENGYQVAIIAPTEVLAEQHYYNFINFVKNNYRAVLLTGSIKKSEKNIYYENIKNKEIDVVIGTHAVLEEKVEFNKLGLAIIDEQHRFGVLQRKSLIDKGYTPNILLMTATPIPRTLSLSIYGDLDISIIDELPPGRTPIITKSASISRFDELIPFIKKEIDRGNNIYFVYPLIEESKKSDLQAATMGYEYLDKYFNGEVALLHGKMKSDEKQKIINDFKEKKNRILVSTTVIEVGVDVPHATVMVIMNAERFGLSQLHQLRGRVGRSDLKSYCFLMHSDNLTEEGEKRIRAMCEYDNGFKLSEIDLEIRGPGDFFGVKQSGLPNLRFADILKDREILKIARRDAMKIIEEDEFLEKSENFIIKQAVKTIWKNSFDMIEVG